MNEQSNTECAYCGEDFDNEHSRGVHISEEHVETDSKITKSKRQHDTRRNIIEDKWKTGKDGESA
jgi:hypothetical protein